MPVGDDNKEKVKKFFEENLAHLKEGNIYSVLGGQDLEILFEETQYENEMKTRPRYE